MLDALIDLSSTEPAVKVPRLYLSDNEAKIQVMEDVPDTIDLKSLLLSTDTALFLPHTHAERLGQKLGSWLRSFHTWSSEPERTNLRAHVAQNQPMRVLKHRITYGGFLNVLERFPEILKEHDETWRIVQETAKRELETLTTGRQDKGEDWGVIHGDFWAGK